MLLNRDYTKKIIKESSNEELSKYVLRLNNLRTRYPPKHVRYGEALSKNEISMIINNELRLRDINLFCKIA